MPFKGGGEAIAAIIGGHVTAGVSGVGEFTEQIKRGRMRALAVSSPSKIEGFPTLKEQKLNVELANWRGVVAPPGISDEGRQCLIALVTQMAASDAWRQTREKYGWQDFFQPGDEFAAYLASERTRVEGILKGLGLVG